MSRLGNAAGVFGGPPGAAAGPYLDPRNQVGHRPAQGYFHVPTEGLGEPIARYNGAGLGPILEDIDDNGNAVVSHGDCKSTIIMDKPHLGSNYELACGHVVAINAQALHQAVIMTLLRKQMFPTLVKPARFDLSP
jgi:hypothetical protein